MRACGRWPASYAGKPTLSYRDCAAPAARSLVRCGRKIELTYLRQGCRSIAVLGRPGAIRVSKSADLHVFDCLRGDCLPCLKHARMNLRNRRSKRLRLRRRGDNGDFGMPLNRRWVNLRRRRRRFHFGRADYRRGDDSRRRTNRSDLSLPFRRSDLWFVLLHRRRRIEQS